MTTKDRIYDIKPSDLADLPKIKHLFEAAMALKTKPDYIVWKAIDQETLIADIEAGLQYEILYHNKIIALFSVQFNDKLIWENRDQDDAVYLHRVVTAPDFKGQRLFQTVLDWTLNFAKLHHRQWVRLDTISSNTQLQAYYLSYGFKRIGCVNTLDLPELPLQNRQQSLTLFQLPVKKS